MRQYKIFFRRGPDAKFGQCQPFIHAGLYNKPEVQEAIAYLRDNPHIEGLALRLNDEQFNLIAFEQDALAPNAFTFPPAPINTQGVVVTVSDVTVSGNTVTTRGEDFVGPAGDM
jgi:hypothetical protein